MVHSQRAYNFPDFASQLCSVKSPAKNRHTTVVHPVLLGTIYCFTLESKMYDILEHTELYLTVLLITMLAISVPWC